MTETEAKTALKPVIILVEPQMGENIGAAARAMLNCGLTELRLVRPRDGWPNERAIAMSSGAMDIMPPPQIFETTAEAMADCRYVMATTARLRDMIKPVFTPRAAAGEIHSRAAQGQKTALLFGAERMGLTNDDVAQAHAVINIPLNPEFSSVNLGQAVLLMAYEWCQYEDSTANKSLPMGKTFPAEQKDIEKLFERFEAELEEHYFFRNPGHRPIMVNNLRTLLTRAEMTDQEVRTFHGVISALTGKKAPPEEK